MTQLSDRVLSQQGHMNRVRSVQRRSAYERVIVKIAAVRSMAPHTDEEVELLKYLVELRGIIRTELIENGQLEAEA